jgi:uncharacterized protein with GYD domain
MAAGVSADLDGCVYPLLARERPSVGGSPLGDCSMQNLLPLGSARSMGLGSPAEQAYDFTGVIGPLGSPAVGRAAGRSTDPRGLPDQFPGERDLPMPLYIYQAAYTPESIAAQIKEPQDRLEAVRPALEALGGKIVVGGYPFGEYDVLVVIEAPDDTTAASFALAVAAGGAAKSAKTTRLLSGQEWIESLRKAQSSQYRPAR